MGHIAFGMAVVVATIGGFGPRTRGLALEAIAHCNVARKLAAFALHNSTMGRKRFQLIRADLLQICCRCSKTVLGGHGLIACRGSRDCGPARDGSQCSASLGEG